MPIPQLRFVPLLFVASCQPPSPAAQAAPQRSAPSKSHVAPTKSPPPLVIHPDELSEHARRRIDELSPLAWAAARAFANEDPRWSPDHRFLSYRSNRDGHYQAYVLPWRHLDSPPPKLIESEHAVLCSEFSSRPEWLLLCIGDSRHVNSLVHVSIDGLTKQAIHPDNHGVLGKPLVAHRASLALFTSRSPNETRLFMRNLSSQELTSPYGQSEPFELLEVSPDGSRGLLRTDSAPSSGGLVELALDVPQPKPTPLASNKGKLIAAAHHSSTNRLAGLVQDKGHVHLEYLGPTSEKGCSCTETFGVLKDVRFSPRTELVAFVSQERGQRVVLLDTKTCAARTVTGLPEGTTALGAFHEGAKVLTVTSQSPCSPPDIYEVDLRKGQAKKLRNDVRPTLSLLAPTSCETISFKDSSTVAMSIRNPKQTLPSRVLVILQDEPSSLLRWNAWVPFLVGQGLAVIQAHLEGTDGLGKLQSWLDEQGWAEKAPPVLLAPTHKTLPLLLGSLKMKERWSAGIAYVSSPPSAAWCWDSAIDNKTPLMLFQSGQDLAAPPCRMDQWIGKMRELGCPVRYEVEESIVEAPVDELQTVKWLSKLGWYVEQLSPKSETQ